MLLELIITLTSGLLLAILALIIGRIISDRLALVRFKILTRGLPVCSGVRLLGNHTLSITIGKNNCETLRNNHLKLGKTYGVLMGNQFCASTTDLDLIKKFIHDEPDGHLSRMKVGLPMEEFENSIMLAHKDEWRQLRRSIAPALASNKFKAPNVVQEVEQSIRKLTDYIDRKLSTEKLGCEFETDDFMHKYSLDLVFRCFYKQYDLIDFDDPNDVWTKTIDGSLNEVQESLFVKLALVFPIFHSFVDWLVWNFTPHGACRKKLVEFVGSQVKLRIEAKKQLKQLKAEAQKSGNTIDENDFELKDGTRFKRNMVDHIVDQYLDGKMSTKQYFNNSCFLMGAADKTATDSLVHTIYLLSVHQDVQDRLRASIKSSGVDSEYLDWVLKESLRLLPPAPTGCSRSIGRDIEIEGGYILPSGTYIATNAYVIHRLERYWGEDADEFKPERWSDTSHHHPFQYIPFGAGQRGCPGKQFAMFEMKMLFVSLLSKYKFEGQARDDIYDFHAPLFIFVIPNSPTKVLIKRL